MTYEAAGNDRRKHDAERNVDGRDHLAGLQVEYAIDQVCNRDEHEVKDALPQEGLDQARTRSTVTAADDDGFHDGHERNDGIERKRREL